MCRACVRVTQNYQLALKLRPILAKHTNRLDLIQIERRVIDLAGKRGERACDKIMQCLQIIYSLSNRTVCCYSHKTGKLSHLVFLCGFFCSPSFRQSHSAS